jgi:hypothetical protein
VNIVILPENENQINSIVSYFIKKGVTVSSSYMADENSIPTKYNYIPERVACKSLFGFMVVLTSGRAVACCRDCKYELYLGNVITDSLENVWNGIRYNNLRTIHLLGKWDKISPCNNCLTWVCGSVAEKEVEGFDGIKKFAGSFWFNYR